MRKWVGVLMIFSLLLSIGSTAQATKTWVSGNIGNWNDGANWGGSVPSSAETAYINNGTCTVDATPTAVPGILLMGGGTASTDVATLNITANMNVYKASSEIFALIKGTAAPTSIVNHSAGTLRVGLAGTTNNGGTCETRLVTGSATLGTATYNLSGTGVLDTDVLSKGNKANSAATFNATGGTLVLRNMIYRFGKASDGAGFNQGAATLEIGADSTVLSVNIGNATNAMDYTAGAGAVLNFDIASASSFDKLVQFVDTVATGTDYANIAGATFGIRLGYVPTPGQTFDVWTYSTAGMATPGAFVGSGAPTLPGGWASQWVDLSGDGLGDTLRLTYIPEPATMALFGLGLLALRRSKK